MVFQLISYPSLTSLLNSILSIFSNYVLNISGFPDSSGRLVGKESACNVGDTSLIPELERSIGEGVGYPLQHSQASLVAQMVKNLPEIWETWVQSLGWKIPWRRERLSTPVFWLREVHGLYSP